MKNPSVQNLVLLDHARPSTVVKNRKTSSSLLVSVVPSLALYDEGGQRNRECPPYYKPRLSLNNGIFNGTEVLGRWSHTELEMLGLTQFLLAVQHHNLISAFEYSMGLALNLHPSQLICKQLLHSHPSCWVVVEETIQLTRTLGPSPVIERAETLAQMKELQAQCCSMIQSFAIARPRPEQRFINSCLQ